MNIALLLSGGTGVRLGSNVPKQYIEISGCPVFSWCLEALAEHEDIDGIQIVADSSWHGTIKAWWENSAVKGEQEFSGKEQELYKDLFSLYKNGTAIEKTMCISLVGYVSSFWGDKNR